MKASVDSATKLKANVSWGLMTFNSPAATKADIPAAPTVARTAHQKSGMAKAKAQPTNVAL